MTLRLTNVCGLLFVTCLSLCDTQSIAQEAKPAATVEKKIPELASDIRKSLVVIRTAGRNGEESSLATGFIISKDGLVATAFHTIAEGHAISVETVDGRKLPVTHVHARLEAADLVVLRVEAEDLHALPLGNSDHVVDGQPVVSVGHPRGRLNSVVSGVVSRREDVGGISMIRLAMPIESGSSGEPVVDRSGRVVAIVTLKSTEKDDTGFAVPVSHLHRVLEDPVPIPIARWVTIGRLDKERWSIRWDANWRRRRATEISVSGLGASFGGRSLCLLNEDTPEVPFEVQVDVKLNDEQGAAGLAFHTDAKDRYYGWYPSNGNLRLTRFVGPSVFTWKILFNEPHDAYVANDWNTLKVRIEEKRMLCYVNEQLVFTSNDEVLKSGRVGLATFRGTNAQFRKLMVAKSIPRITPSDDDAESIAQILNRVTSARPASRDAIQSLLPHSMVSGRTIEQEARVLEARAKHLRLLAAEVHAAAVTKDIEQALKEDPPNMLRAALLIARLDNPDVEPEPYIKKLKSLAEEIRLTFPRDATEAQRLAAIDKMMFEEYGFRGARFEYYSRENSYLNEVIDDREGLPISLSVIYMELARMLDVTVVGLGLPGHFIVRFEPSDGDHEPELIDVFNKGKRLSRDEAEAIARSRQQNEVAPFFEALTTQQITERMVRNLLGLAMSEKDDERVLRYVSLLLALDENDSSSRIVRMDIQSRTGRLSEAIDDVNWFIEHNGDDTNLDQMYEFRAQLQRQLDRQNAKLKSSKSKAE